jgi:hypothetical protein
VLDEVIWLARTQEQDALDWIDDLVKNEPLYTLGKVPTYGGEFASSYDLCQDDVMYIKIDDDIASCSYVDLYAHIPC